MLRRTSSFFTAAAMALLFSGSALASSALNLYTTREPALIQPLLDAFMRDNPGQHHLRQGWSA